jgi:major membrane immunogen (membrane-anchored lipoprotein)
MAYGDIGAVIDTLEFDAGYTERPSVVHVSGDVYAIAYRGVDDDGWLKTVTIESDGQIGAAVIDSFEFDAVAGDYPEIIHVSGDVYAIVYQCDALDGCVTTVTIEANGQVGAAVIDSLEFDAAACYDPGIIHVSGDVYAIAYTGWAGDGFLKTVTILANGQIGAAAISSLEFETDRCTKPDFIHISGDVYAIAYQGPLYYGRVTTVTIEADGQIGVAVIDSFVFDAATIDYPKIIHIAGDVYAIVYQDAGLDGWVATVTIEADGQIGAAVIDTFEFFAGIIYPSVVHVGLGNVYAIACQGPDLDGWIATVTIEADGQIGAAVIDTFEFDEEDGHAPVITHVSGDVYAIAYRGVDGDGWLKTLDIGTTPLGGPKHLMILGVG